MLPTSILNLQGILLQNHWLLRKNKINLSEENCSLYMINFYLVFLKYNIKSQNYKQWVNLN